MYLTGIADEASQDGNIQISTTKTLGWNAIEARCLNGKNLHDVSDTEFEEFRRALDDAEVYVNAFGSAIANWGKDVRDDFSITLDEVNRAIPRMKALGSKMVRIMSYKVVEGEDLMVDERIRRLKIIVDLFAAEGISAIHENCMNYGGLSWQHTLELIDAIPGMKLVFDTANPVFNRDRSKDGQPWQDPWEFYQKVREHIAYVHIKDCLEPSADNGGKEVYLYPGEGQGKVREILADLQANGYEGGISIEPHLAAVFHDANSKNAESGDPVEIYIEYGRKLEAILDDLNFSHKPYQP
ncbi:MAG: sugar phosphate isomerase [Opitutae bacterium]|nr:sugar phosphate isomerase [Opitutae bacterium]